MLWCFDFVFCLLRVWICLFADFLETWVLSGLSVLRFADSVCGVWVDTRQNFGDLCGLGVGGIAVFRVPFLGFTDFGGLVLFC